MFFFFFGLEFGDVFFFWLPTFLSCFFLGSSSCMRLVKWALILLILKSRCSGAISIGSYPPILVVGMKVRYSQFKICCCNPGGNCCWVVDPMYPLDLFWSLFFWMLPKAPVCMGNGMGGSCCNSLDPSKMIRLLIEVLATSGLHRSALSAWVE